MVGSTLIINEFADQNIPVENLHLESLSSEEDVDQLIDGISRCKMLKILRIDICVYLNLKSSHIHKISERLGELTELHLNFNQLSMSINDILHIIQKMEKLRLLCHQDGIPYKDLVIDSVGTIDSNVYTEMVNIVEKSNLKIRLNAVNFYVVVPNAMRIMHEDSVILEQEENYSLFQRIHYPLNVCPLYRLY